MAVPHRLWPVLEPFPSTRPASRMPRGLTVSSALVGAEAGGEHADAPPPQTGEAARQSYEPFSSEGERYGTAAKNASSPCPQRPAKQACLRMSVQ
jgi:hypothetical protein